MFDLDQFELEEVYTFIKQLNQSVVNRFGEELPIPLGIMIDHRFKKSIWDEQLFSFAEGSHSEWNGRSIVRPIFQSVVHDNPALPNTVQVAWSAFPNSEFFEPSLTAVESETLTELERLVAGFHPDKAIGFVKELEAYLSLRSEVCID